MSRHKPARVKGMLAERAMIPLCSSCGSRLQRDDVGKWFCLECADAWLREYVQAKTGHKSIGGVELPTAVKDERKAAPSFRDLMPNRRERRRLQKLHRRLV